MTMSTGADGHTPAVPPPPPLSGEPERLPLTGVVERLLGAAAVLGAALFVLINGLYIEFYDDFGVRPEQVGLDRLAVLGRAGWVALAALPVLALGLAAFAWSRRPSGAEEAHEVSSALEELRHQQRVADRRQRMQHLQRALMLMTSAFLVFLLAGFAVLVRVVDDQSSRVALGESVNGIGPLVPFLDFRANRADVAWLGDPERQPASLRTAGHLMYLGSGQDVVVLLACGRETIIVPAGQVSITLRYQGSASGRGEQAEREDLTRSC